MTFKKEDIHKVPTLIQPCSDEVVEYILKDKVLEEIEKLRQEMCCESDCDKKYRCMNCKNFDDLVRDIK